MPTRRGPGRPPKGPRTRINLLLPDAFADLVRAEAAHRGMTLIDFINEALAHELDVELPEHHPKRLQRELPLTG